MVIYPDTSFIIPLYTPEPFTENALQFLARTEQALAFTPFHRLEFRTAMRTRVFRQRMPREELREAFRQCEHHLKNGVFQHTPLHWADTLREAERIAEAHLTEIGARSGDLLHVASAVVLGARDFVTFDERQTELARRAGLKVRGIRRA
jgi:predicted nucleic acid-binding protein